MAKAKKERKPKKNRENVVKNQKMLESNIELFKKLKLTNIISEVGDGFLGWPKLAPFDHIIITCAIENLDYRILNQIRVNGTCIAPVGPPDKEQRLKKITIKNNRKDDIWEDLGKVSFVPLITNYD